ncbi:O-antigen ligase domain-containing protein [Mucilaginibacter achroorhodeus]|uniref:O-antigen ligase domain-containing protein n=1 Tax=Mucilaginibacter achroorhodeus TaxID=2599294 RepID=A0A563U2T8_9SPHI|nr:O-antigen ligase family protein [Mucilaginibacter achroorhodeus]TWR25650.1 O-antigen ligase domain-containing protein [Mucilaginibacter achroorhodeus]
MLNQAQKSNPVISFCRKLVTGELSTPTMILVFLPLAVLIAVAITFGGIIAAGAILALIIGVPLVLAIIAYPIFGIAVFMVLAFFMNYISEPLPPETPTGIVLDILTYLLIFGFLLKFKYDRDWSHFQNPISYWILAWLAYNFFEAINPASPSILAWIYTVRTVAFIMLMYFIFLYQIRTKKTIKFLFKLWLILAFLSALSGFQQENIGLLPMEKAWYAQDPLRLSFLYINGHLRKVAIFPDPVTFAYNMVVAALLCLCLLFTKIKTWKKVVLGLSIPFFFLVMLYSGTRGAFVLPPAALALLAVMNYNKKILMMVGAAALVLGALIFMPTSNQFIKRFQTAFRPSDDASFNVRAENQRKIKPYILSHPIGGGLGSVGIWGRRFAPNSFLAKFPPDSGYVRVAVEMGYVGLLLFCALMFVILKTGINNYYLIKDPELKMYCLAMVLIIFVFNIGNYPQQALVQYPSNILFYLACALLSVTLRLDKQEREKSVNQSTQINA